MAVSSPSGVSRQLLASAEGDSRMAQWVKYVENVDIQTAEIQVAQLKGLRDQVTALVQDLASVRSEVCFLKGKQGDFEQHEKSIMVRVATLETGAGQFSNILDNTKQDVEGLRQFLDATNKALEDAKVLSADKVASVSKRLDELKDDMLNGFDQKWREIQELKTSITEHSACLFQNGRDFNQLKTSMDERLKSLEKNMSDTFEKHGADLIGLKQADEKKHREIADVKSQISPIEVKLDSIAAEFTQTYEKHFNQLSVIKDSVAKGWLAQAKAEKDVDGLKVSLGRFSTVNDDIALIQDSLAEMSATHVKELKDFQGGVDKQFDKVVKDASTLKSQQMEMDARLASLDRSVESFMDSHRVEVNLLKESKDKLAHDVASLGLQQKKNMAIFDKLILSEKTSGELLVKHSLDLQSLKEDHEKHACDVDQRFQASLEQVNAGEKSVADLGYKTGKDIQVVKTALDKHVQDFLRATEDIEIKRNELAQQNHFLDVRCAAATEKMTADIVDLKDTQLKLQHSITLLQGEDDGLGKKVASVEGLLEGEEQKRAVDVSNLKAMLQKQTDAQGKSQQDVKMLDDLHKTLNERVAGLETCLKDTRDVQAQEVADLKTSQGVVARDVISMKNSSVKLNADTVANATDQADIKDRLSTLENRLRQCFNVP